MKIYNLFCCDCDLVFEDELYSKCKRCFSDEIEIINWEEVNDDNDSN